MAAAKRTNSMVLVISLPIILVVDMKVKFFEATVGTGAIESKVNEFIKNKDVVDIRMMNAPDSSALGKNTVYVLIMYR